jgi:hypothetical protein
MLELVQIAYRTLIFTVFYASHNVWITLVLIYLDMLMWRQYHNTVFILLLISAMTLYHYNCCSVHTTISDSLMNKWANGQIMMQL